MNRGMTKILTYTRRTIIRSMPNLVPAAFSTGKLKLNAFFYHL